MKSPEELAAMGLERVPWDCLADVKLEAWYRKDDLYTEWFRFINVYIHYDKTVTLYAATRTLNISGTISAENFTISELANSCEHSLDNGQTWHPCTKVQTIGGAKPDFNQVSVGGEQINKNVT